MPNPDRVERPREEADQRLQDALRAAQAASVEKSRFLATMSHEIRTPINAILGYADLLDMGVAGALTADQQKYLDRLRASGKHLLTLIEDILDFSRVEAGRVHLEPERLRLLHTLEASLALLRPSAEAAQLEVITDCPRDAFYWGDDLRVQQVLTNLIGNAVKFTPVGGHITITCGSDATNPDAELAGPGPWSFLSVEDTGIGIPEESLETVFEPFVQVDNALTRRHQGSGLGLAISRRLTRMMGGELTVQSRPGVGSVFTVWLPGFDVSTGFRDGSGVGEQPHSLALIGQRLGEAANRIVRSMEARLRRDPLTPHARNRTGAELADHTATLLTDLAQALVALEESGPETRALVQDGHDVQGLVSRRHGLQRRRLGWSEHELIREHEIIREELESAIREAGSTASREAVAEATTIARRLLDRAADMSIRGFREADQVG